MTRRPKARDEDERDPFLEAMGARIRDARQRAGLSGGEVAEATGSNKAWVYAVEDGQQNFQIQGLRRLLKVLDLDLRDILPPDPGEAAFRDRAARIHEVTSNLMLQLGSLTTLLNELHALTAPSKGKAQGEP